MVKQIQQIRRGFTLIEMMVVMAIVALLLTISLPRYFGALERSKEVVLKENLQTIRNTIDKFHADRGRYPESLDELVVRQYLRAVPYDPLTESDGTWLFVAPPTTGVDGIYDVRSGSTGATKDGKPYALF